MSKYEFKAFSLSTFDADKEEGWKPTYRVSEDYPTDNPRELDVVYLGPKAAWKESLVSIDLKEGGAVRTHSAEGLFGNDQKPCVLDIILYRDARPKPREIRGVAILAQNGEFLSAIPEYATGEVSGCKPVACTITLHEGPNHERNTK